MNRDESDKTAKTTEENPTEAEHLLPESVAACLKNAEELLNACRLLLDHDGLPRVAYHLAALGLEEIGKARLLRTAEFAQKLKQEVPDIVRTSLMDRGHIKRIFWAIWTETFGQEKVDGKQIEETRGLARRIHETRLRGLYVDADGDVLLSPFEVVSPEQASGLVRFTEIRLELERGFGAREVDAETDPLFVWFMSAADDHEISRLIFGNKSMEKLAELKNVREWVRWLKETFDTADAEARLFAEREISRAVSNSADAARDKWRMRFRLHSASHAIRPKPLTEWNSRVEWLKLERPQDKDQLLVELILPDRVLAKSVYHSAWALARQFVTALNMATFGFFWWELPVQTSRHYEKLTDLETGREVVIEPTPPLDLDWGKGRRVLSEDDIKRVHWVFALLVRMSAHHELAPALSRYIEGLTWLSKANVHMPLHLHAFGTFYHSLRLAMQVETPVSGGVEIGAADVSAKIRELQPKVEAPERYAEVGEAFVKDHALPISVTALDAFMMKVLCDLFWLRHVLPARAAGLEDN